MNGDYFDSVGGEALFTFSMCKHGSFLQRYSSGPLSALDCRGVQIYNSKFLENRSWVVCW